MSLRDKKDLSGVSIQDTFCRNMGIEEKHQEVFIFFGIFSLIFQHVFAVFSPSFFASFTAIKHLSRVKNE